MNLFRKIFPPNDWTIVKTYTGNMHWTDINIKEIISYYHIESSENRKKFRLRIEKVKGTYFDSYDMDPKGQKIYKHALDKVTELNLAIASERNRNVDVDNNENRNINNIEI